MIDYVSIYKELYPKGTRVELMMMGGHFAPIPVGTIGTVEFVDNLGRIHVKWDNGIGCCLVPSKDIFKKIFD